MKTIHLYDSVERQHYLFNHPYTFKLKPRLLYAGTLKKSPGWCEKPHTHDFCEIIFISDGRGYITIGNEQREVKRGDIIIYNSGVLHAEANSQTEPLEMKFMALEHLEITDLPKNHLLPPGYDFIYPAERYIDIFVSGFDSIIAEIEDSDTFYVEITESIVKTMILYLLRIINQQEDAADLFHNNRNLTLALQYIKANYRNHISLDDISANCYLNKYYLSHLFSEIQGTSIGKYIQELRLGEAMKRLRETNDSVSIIAQSVGFDDTGYFCRIFKKETALTPLQYRKAPVSE
ncbi:MAG: helix-turn-helix transcriptional regulator [Roseburia sp.]|nr:helix-turn-helix transcriptional regulator [Roseburia sp.]